MKLTALMKTFPRFSLKPPSMFFWLLLSFLSIVLLLFLFILYSVFFFRGQIKEEVITYNNVNLRNTTENYEAKFQLIENAVLTFSMNDKIEALDKPNFDYVLGQRLMDDIQNFLSNHSMLLDNMIVYFKNSGVALEQSRGSDADIMFNRYLVSAEYSYEFWNTLLEARFVTRILPSSRFSELEFSNRPNGGKILNPIIIKNRNHPSVMFIALADSQKMYNTFHQSINDNFYIVNDVNQPYFSTGMEESSRFPAFEGSVGYVKRDNQYYFYKKGARTGLSYVNVIPDDNIASQMKWSMGFVALLIVSVVLSIVVSLLFSIRLNRPVKRLVHSIQQLTTGHPWKNRSGIKEFNIIQENVRHLLNSNWDISQNLNEKKSLLRQYAYINKLKKIRNNTDYLKDLIVIKDSYRFILFKLTFRLRLLEEIDDDVERATSFIREFIDKIISERHPGSLTLQLENDQLLSVVYSESDEQALLKTLDEIRQVLDLDRAFCFLTITVSNVHEQPDDFNASFERTQALLLYRKFNDRTQIISESDDKPAPAYLLPVQQEEMNVRLNFGNEAQIAPYVKRELAAMRKKEASESQVKLFLDNMLERAKRDFMACQLDTELLQPFQTSLLNGYSFEELDTVIEEWLPRIAELISSKKEKKDHITSFVFDYLENNYTKDITLDMMADKLNISRSYLSTYFKEKTGTYFVDYVNLFRVNRAKELLLRSDVKIQDAAGKVGYQNINSFNRMFKKFTGVTPSEFRRMERV